MNKKVTWKRILEDFKLHYPTMRKQVSYWCPYDYAEILIILKDNTRMVYNYDTHRATIIKL